MHSLHSLADPLPTVDFPPRNTVGDDFHRRALSEKLCRNIVSGQRGATVQRRGVIRSSVVAQAGFTLSEASGSRIIHKS